MPKRIGLSRLAAIALAMLVLPQVAAAGGRDLFPDSIALPNGFRPEGIAIGRGATIFAGSIGTGAIFAANLVTGEGSILVPAQPGRAAIGLSYDPRSDIIYVAGGPTGQGYAYDARTGATVAVFQFTTETATFVNDQVIVDDAVYFTDSQRAVLYKVPLSRRARPVASAVTQLALGGEWQQVAGFNANGIVAPFDGRSLIVVNSSLGALFRVDARTGNAARIDLGDANVTAGDGMLLRGDKLLVVQNQLNQVAVFDLDRRLAHGELEQVLTGTALDVPTTIDNFFGLIYVVNARFSTPPTADTTYTIEKVRSDD